MYTNLVGEVGWIVAKLEVTKDTKPDKSNTAATLTRIPPSAKVMSAHSSMQPCPVNHDEKVCLAAGSVILRLILTVA